MADYRERLHHKMMEAKNEVMEDGTQSRQSQLDNIRTVSGSLEVVREQRSEGKMGPQYLAALAATMGSLVMGTAIAWSGPAGPPLQLPFDQGGFAMTDDQESWMGSLMPLGALFGGPAAGIMMGKLGRKGAMIATAVMFALSYLLLVLAPNMWVIYAGRIASGLCTGIASGVCPVYVAETASANVRGFLGSCVQLMVTFGVLFVFIMGITGSFRWLSVFCIGCCVVWILLLLLIPETPAYYLSKKKYREARESLEWLRGGVNVETEYEEIQRGAQGSGGQSTGMAELLKRRNLIPLGISLMLMLGQQLSGVNAVIFYTPKIFALTGSTMPDTLESIIVALVQVVACAIGASIMDKLGRRLLLNLSSSVMVISAAGLGAFFYIKINMNNEALADKIEFLPLASLSIFIFAFSIGFGPIPWLMMSELFSPEVKGPASSISVTFNWTLAFLVTKFFSTVSDAISIAGAFWLFSGVTAIVFLFCLLAVPETKGKSLEEIQRLFEGEDEHEDLGPIVEQEVY